jgi:hypothetical protein
MPVSFVFFVFLFFVTTPFLALLEAKEPTVKLMGH